MNDFNETVKAYAIMDGPTHTSEHEELSELPEGYVVTYLAKIGEDYGPFDYWFDSLEAFEKTKEYLDQYVQPFTLSVNAANLRPI